MDRAQLAHFLRTRREALRPEDVGVPRGRRRRTGGLRREEVAALSDMSVDYYSRIEQRRGPTPSERMLTAIAHALRLSVEERDHLLRLAGHAVPPRLSRGDHVDPGMLRVLDRLEDTPAQVMNHLGETLKQTGPAAGLLGDDGRHTGMARSLAYRWFTDPGSRLIFPEDDHAAHGRAITALLRDAYTRDRGGSRVTALVDALLASGPEFAAIWHEHPVAGPYCEPKRIRHPRLGLLELHGENLLDPGRSQRLVIFTAVPGSESHEKLRMLSASGDPARART
jgi:transcriptional regulator with XRE-family HTH domain